jgi:arginine-tRNA-protein transferase
MTLSSGLRLLPGKPASLLVHDQAGPCSYLPDRTWRLPLRLPLRDLEADELDEHLAHGDRRQGRLLYRTECPSCCACEPIRVDVESFRPSRTQRRAWHRWQEDIDVEIGPVEIDEARAELFNVHKRGRDLNCDDDDTSIDSYAAFLGNSCCNSFEMRYSVGGERLGIAIVDRGASSMSAVYFYYHPKFSHMSPGVLSIMRQIKMCRSQGRRYLYLGLYIADCAAMNYKARYMPHERLIDGRWQRFERGA